MRNWSALTAVRSGQWNRLDPGTLGWLAAVAAALDALTTSRVILSPAYWEGNEVFADIAASSPRLAVLAFGTFAAASVLVSWLSLGWVSKVSASVSIVSFGVGGINNSVLFATGTALYEYAGLAHDFVIFYAAPAAGVILGLAVLARNYSRIPWNEVTVGVPLFLLVQGLLPVIV